jgi:hypothetical protein
VGLRTQLQVGFYGGAVYPMTVVVCPCGVECPCWSPVIWDSLTAESQFQGQVHSLVIGAAIESTMGYRSHTWSSGLPAVGGSLYGGVPTRGQVTYSSDGTGR